MQATAATTTCVRYVRDEHALTHRAWRKPVNRYRHEGREWGTARHCTGTALPRRTTPSEYSCTVDASFTPD